MLPVKSFITESELQRLATRSNFRYGKDMAKDFSIKITDQNTFNIIATIESPSKKIETIELRSTTKGFRYKCSCSARKNNFCEHLVAVGFFCSLQAKN